jgi:glycosyltransferase involved in cell wall biosynthesis
LSPHLDSNETELGISVCILVTDLDAATGGVQRNTRLLMRAFGDRGVRTYICTRNYEGRPHQEDIGDAKVYRSPVFGRSRGLNGIMYFAYVVFWLIFNRNKYDVVHCQQMFGPAMAAAIAGIFTGRPPIVRITLSGPTGEAEAIRTMPFSGLRLRLLKRIARWIVLTREMRDEIAAIGIREDRIRVVYNGTDLPAKAAYENSVRAEKRAELGLPAGNLGIFVGRLSEEKNLDTLIRSWVDVSRAVPDSHLLLLGADSAYRGAESVLRQLAAELNISSNVHFLGHRTEVKNYLLASDVFILPSSAEGMSNALVEAFACGLPIVASRIEANMELCADGLDSLTVPVSDEAAIASAICRIFEDEGLAQVLAENARAKAENFLSADNMIDAYLAIYSEALSENAAA